MANDNRNSKLEITSLEEQYNIEVQKFQQELNEIKKKKRSNVLWRIITIIVLVIVVSAIVVPGILIYSCRNGDISFSSCNRTDDSKYSLDKIYISVSKKENDIEKSIYINGKTVGIYFEVTNNSSEVLSEINGEMNVYLGDNNYLMTWDIRLSGNIASGKSKQLIVKCDSNSNSNMDKFYNAELQELNLTYTISYVYFGTTASDIKRVDDSSAEERIIKPYDETEAQALLEIKESKYMAAMALFNQGKYDEAYLAFSEIENYKDASEKLWEIIELLDNNGGAR